MQRFFVFAGALFSGLIFTLGAPGSSTAWADIDSCELAMIGAAADSTPVSGTAKPFTIRRHSKGTLAALMNKIRTGEMVRVSAARPSRSTPPSSRNPSQKAALAAAVPFKRYFDSARSRLKERAYLIELAQLALIAKEHLLLMGPPGNAKSMLADEVLGNIIDGATKAPSYYRIQMTPETTLSETHGPLDYKTLTETNRYERIYEEGMLLSRNGFVDEIFDARANAIRNILGLLNERIHAQGPRIRQGKIETVIAATNRYISEVYERAGDDSPKALLDRFAFSAFVPGDFEQTQSAISLIMAAKRDQQVPVTLTFQELDAIRALVKEVEIPEYVAKYLTLLRGKIKSETENIEQGELKSYKDKLRNGEDPRPPYRATKYMSPRTLGKSAGILRAIVVQDWLMKGGQRKLQANLEDLRKLEAFYSLNGPSDAFVEAQLAASTNPHEQAQLSAIIQEREIFRRNFDQINNAMNTTLYQYALTELQAQMSGKLLPHEKEQLVYRLMALVTEIQDKRTASGKLSDLTGEEIGLDHVYEFLVDSLKELLGNDFQKGVAKVIADAEAARARIIEAQKTAEEKRLEEERRQQEAQRRADEALRLAEEVRRARAQKLIGIFRDPDNFDIHVGSPGAGLTSFYLHDSIPGSDQAVVYNNSSRRLEFVSASGFPFFIEGRGDGRVVEKILTQSMGEITKVMRPDEEHVILVTGRTVWTFDAKTGDEKINFQLSPATGDVIHTLSPDRKSLAIFDPSMSRLSYGDWQTGVTSKVDLSSRINIKVPGVAAQTLGDVAGLLYPADLLRFSEDGKRAYFTAGSMQSLYEIDLATGQVSYLYFMERPTDTFYPLPDVRVPNRMYSYSVSHSQVVLLEMNLTNPSESKTHTINVANAQIQRQGVTVLEEGRVALIGTENRGLVLVDLNTNQEVADHAMGSPNCALGPKDFGNGKIGYWAYDGHEMRYRFAVLKNWSEE